MPKSPKSVRFWDKCQVNLPVTLETSGLADASASIPTKGRTERQSHAVERAAPGGLAGGRGRKAREGQNVVNSPEVSQIIFAILKTQALRR